ncbi:MAG: site-specific integrase [Deltaproteobacteria bacterium]|nr:site-specific integrase [Deltaproteobacteria bacterium]
MFRDAQVEELVDSNPCVLRKGELPKMRDKDPTWRVGAVFVRSELIPVERRTFYAVLFLGGLRFGEVSALRVGRYDRNRQPLGCLLVAESYDTKTKKVGPLKTDTPREVPVHPALARILATWLLEGWRATFGRAPGPDDLLIPYPDLRSDADGRTFWRSDTCRKRLHDDCMLLGFRHRRTHDTRRTFITLARSDGARDDVLKWATHGRPEGIMNLYSELPWELLSGEVAKLKVDLTRAEVIELRQAIGAPEFFDTPFDSGRNHWKQKEK